MEKVYIVTLEVTQWYAVYWKGDYSETCEDAVTTTEIIAATNTKKKGLAIGRYVLDHRLTKFLAEVASHDSFESPLFKKSIAPDHALVVADEDYCNAIELRLIVKPLKVV